MKIKLSIVIANYNRDIFVDRAIRSCLSQILFRTNYEVIVVDDCSEDNSMNIISEFSDDVIIIKNKKNCGIAYTSNIGLEAASGEYWMRVDSDDFLNEFACNYMISILDENSDINFVYCDHYRVDVHGVKVEKIRMMDNETLFHHGAGVMFRREILNDIGGYDPSLRSAEDYDLLVRLLNAGNKGYHIPIPLYRYYIHGNNMTLNDERDMYVNMVRSRYDI